MYPTISCCTLIPFLLSFFLSQQQSRTLWQAVTAVSPHLWAPCPTRPQAAPAPAHTPCLDHGTLSVPSRNGSPIPSARWALMPEEEREKSRSRCAGQTGGNRRHFFPTVNLSWGLWCSTTTTPSSPLEIRWDFYTFIRSYLLHYIIVCNVGLCWTGVKRQSDESRSSNTVVLPGPNIRQRHTESGNVSILLYAMLLSSTLYWIFYSTWLYSWGLSLSR